MPVRVGVVRTLRARLFAHSMVRSTPRPGEVPPGPPFNRGAAVPNVADRSAGGTKWGLEPSDWPLVPL